MHTNGTKAREVAGRGQKVHTPVAAVSARDPLSCGLHPGQCCLTASVHAHQKRSCMTSNVMHEQKSCVQDKKSTWSDATRLMLDGHLEQRQGPSSSIATTRLSSSHCSLNYRTNQSSTDCCLLVIWSKGMKAEEAKQPDCQYKNVTEPNQPVAGVH